jgi:josephin
LPFLHPHRTLSTGNWDVTVLDLALQQVDRTLKWNDQRDTEFAKLDLRDCYAVIINVRNNWSLPFLEGRHWFALRKIGGSWYNLDSRLERPELIVSPLNTADQVEIGVRSFLKNLVHTSDAKVFTIE